MSRDEQANRAYQAAARNGDLVGIAEAVLELDRPIERWQMAKTLHALGPFLSDDAARLLESYAPIDKSDAVLAETAKIRTPPVSLTANLDRSKRIRVWRVLIDRGDSRALKDAASYVDPPAEVIPRIVDTIFATASKHVAPSLGAFSSALASYHVVDPAASATWYARWLGRRAGVARKVGSAPEWVAALHTEQQLDHLVQLLVARVAD